MKNPNSRDAADTPRDTDDELISQFVRTRSEEAFHRIVLRHGPLVMRVCRDVMRCREDAEDAFQATFLLLSTHPERVRKRTSLASWLYGTAYRTCLHATRVIHRRKETPLMNTLINSRTPFEELADAHDRLAVHEEINRLPETYRVPLIICYLEGRSRQEAADTMSCSLQVVKGRLERGRNLLRSRLLARGVAGGLAVALCACPASASTIPPALIASTTSAAVAPAGSAAVSDLVAQLLGMPQTTGAAIKGCQLTRLGLAGCALLVLFGASLGFLFVTPSPSSAADNASLDLTIGPLDGVTEPTRSEPKLLALATPREDGADDVPEMTWPEDGVLRSRSRVGSLHWVADGRFLLFGGAVDPEVEPGVWSNEMWISVGAGRKARLPAAAVYGALDDGSMYGTADAVTLDGDVELRLYGLGRNDDEPRGLLLSSMILPTDQRILQLRSLDFSSDGKRAFVFGWNFLANTKGFPENHIFVIDVENQKLVSHYRNTDGQLFFGDVSEDGTLFLTTHLSRDGTSTGLQVRDVETGELIHDWPTKRQFTWRARFSPDGSRIAAIGHCQADYKGEERWGKFVSIYDLKNGELERKLKGHTKAVSAVAFSPDGDFIAGGSADKQALVWNVESGEVVQRFSGHKGIIDAVAFSPDGRKLATGDRRKSIRFWDLETP